MKLKLLLTFLGAGLLNAAYAQQPSQGPPASVKVVSSSQMNPSARQSTSLGLQKGTSEDISMFLKGKNNPVNASELMKFSFKARTTMIDNFEQYNITKGVVTKSELDALPVSSRLIVLDHPELFEIK